MKADLLFELVTGYKKPVATGSDGAQEVVAVPPIMKNSPILKEYLEKVQEISFTLMIELHSYQCKRFADNLQ